MDAQNPYQSTPGTLEGKPAGPGLVELLFSFKGRATRTQYWLAHLALVGLLIGTIALMGLAGAFAKDSDKGDYALLLLIPAGIAYFWINLAVSVKRCHDRGKSGAFVLINLIPYIGGFWFFIEAGCLDGNVGPNEYGPDPKGRTAPQAPVPVASPDEPFPSRPAASVKDSPYS
ncbi:MAG: DUF805 domain-containing protein [Leptospirales bacterium]|nr:DUF805 domain-containing protein [Leptospirales bacterium]